MNSPKFLLKVLFSEFFKNFFLFKAAIISFIYYATAIFLINYKTFLNFIFNDYPIFTKVKILFLLFIGTIHTLSFKDLAFILVIAILFGLNFELILRKLKFLKNTGNLQITFGVGVLSLFAAGCASCGLSLASVAGVAGILIFLPFNGLELYVISIVILIISLFFNLKTLVRVCKIK